MKPLYFVDETNKIFNVVYEDYFITVTLFSFNPSISQYVGSSITNLRRDRLTLECIETTKERFENALASVKLKLEI